jgi:transposase
MAKMQKRYDAEFKKNAVQLYFNSGKPASHIAKDLGVSIKTFYGWIHTYKQDQDQSFRGKGIARSSNEEVLVLKKQLAEMTLERDILKKAVAIFSNPRAKGMSL